MCFCLRHTKIAKHIFITTYNILKINLMSIKGASSYDSVDKYISELKKNNISVVAIDISVIVANDKIPSALDTVVDVFFKDMLKKLEKNSINVAIIVDHVFDSIDSFKKTTTTTEDIQQFRSGDAKWKQFEQNIRQDKKMTAI